MDVTVGVRPENSPAPPPAGPTHTPLQTHLLSVEDMLKHLKQNKLTEGKPLKPQPHRLSTSADNVCLVGENSGRIKWIQPSGKKPVQTLTASIDALLCVSHLDACMLPSLTHGCLSRLAACLLTL